MIKNCICCKKRIPNYGNNKYCSACAVFTLDLRKSISYYKSKAKKLNIKLYGQENGAERLR